MSKKLNLAVPLALCAVLALSACSDEEPVKAEQTTTENPYYTGTPKAEDSPDDVTPSDSPDDVTPSGSPEDGETEAPDGPAHGEEGHEHEEGDEVEEDSFDGEEHSEGEHSEEDHLFGFVSYTDSEKSELGTNAAGPNDAKLASAIRPNLVKYFVAYYSLNSVGSDTTSKYLFDGANSRASSLPTDFRFLVKNNPDKAIAMRAAPKGPNGATVVASIIVSPPDSTQKNELYTFKMDWVSDKGKWYLKNLYPLS